MDWGRHRRAGAIPDRGAPAHRGGSPRLLPRAGDPRPPRGLLPLADGLHLRRSRPARRRERVVRRRRREGLGRRPLARGVRGRRPLPDGAVHPQGRDGGRGRAPGGEQRRHLDARAHAHRARDGGAEAALPPLDPPRRGGLVAGLLRAGSGLRPRLPDDARGARRRRVRRQRSEDLDLLRALRVVDRAPRADRPGRAEAPRHLAAAHLDAGARRLGATAHRRGVGATTSTRPSSRTCACRRIRSSARRTAAGTWR